MASFLYTNGKRYYAEVILKEVYIFGYGNKTYFKTVVMIKSCELIDENKEYTKQFCFKAAEKEKNLFPIIYCIFKMTKDPIGASFITASKIGSTKQISKSAANILST